MNRSFASLGLSFVLWTSGGSSLRAESLANILHHVQKNNPELLATREAWQAARARVTQATAFEKPRLDIERMYAPRSENPFHSADEKSWSISQSIPFPIGWYYRIKEAQIRADQSETVYHSREREIEWQTKQAYWTLFRATRANELADQNIVLVKQLMRSAEARYASGQITQMDAVKAQMEHGRLLKSKIEWEQERLEAIATLNVLMNRPIHETISVSTLTETVAPALTLDALLEQAKSQNPELQRMILETREKQAMAGTARSEFFPETMVTYRQRTMLDGTRTHDAIVGLSVPIWFWRQTAMVNEARHESKRAAQSLESTGRILEHDVHHAWLMLESMRQMSSLYRTSLLPQSRQAFHIARANYESGKMPFFEWLDAWRMITENQMEALESQVAYQKAVADLERLAGSVAKQEARDE